MINLCYAIFLQMDECLIVLFVKLIWKLYFTGHRTFELESQKVIVDI